MTGQLPLLFQTFPDLKHRVGWVSLGSFPTPIHALPGFGHTLWVKRDDQSGKRYGGNKVRKLEFILGEARRQNRSHVVTLGGLGTHHGLATAIYCQAQGMSCTLILFPQPLTREVKENILLCHYWGAQLVGTGGMLAAGIHFYGIQRVKQPAAYFLYAGGSTPIGTLGYVDAAFELKSQVADGQAPEPDYIFCPLGSNGTLAGLALGCRLAGLKSTVVGVRVAASRVGPIKLADPESAQGLMKKTHQLLRSAAPSHVPLIEIPKPRVLHDYYGEGYGHPTRAGMKAALKMEERAGIRLDPTYTAKTFAAVMDFMEQEAGSGATVLYWHTYNSRDLGAEAVGVDYRSLPGAFHGYFESAAPEPKV